jgi:hypothetical protein
MPDDKRGAQLACDVRAVGVTRPRALKRLRADIARAVAEIRGYLVRTVDGDLPQYGNDFDEQRVEMDTGETALCKPYLEPVDMPPLQRADAGDRLTLAAATSRSWIMPQHSQAQLRGELRADLAAVGTEPPAVARVQPAAAARFDKEAGPRGSPLTAGAKTSHPVSGSRGTPDNDRASIGGVVPDGYTTD